jgi:hypothetical protein
MIPATREHDAESRECWCGPELLRLCSQCGPEPAPECWLCGGRGVVPAGDIDDDEPRIIVHRHEEG